MSSRRINKSAIRRQVKDIGRAYEKEWKRYGPKLPIEPESPHAGLPESAREADVPDRFARRARVRQAFLMWFARHENPHPGWGTFIEEVAELDGEPITEEERDEAVQRLLDDELLGGSARIEESDWPMLLELTANGRRCVQDLDGDTVLWANKHHRVGAIYNDYRDQRDQRVFAQGASGQVAAHSLGAHQEQQNVELDLRTVRSAARYLLANIDDLDDEGFAAEARDGVEELASELVEAANNPVAEHGALRRIASRLNATLLSHPVTAGLASGGTSGTASALLTAALN
ncbi:hypothetical protein [Actinomycetospora sp. CA-053990]|uniref:hypothetical protein n=1 Tax=Actinomycetospora sp. CA-053990 TaxID=3239891 RepID=UPI003D8B181D